MTQKDPVIHSFLLIGQSNMAGRGIIGDVPAIDHRGLMFMLRNGRWQPMTEPINPDRQIFVARDSDIRSGISLGASFAEAFVSHYHEPVGLIPCADGGTSIDQWAVGGLLYDHAVMQTRLAMRTSQLAGILWHQGESDSKSAETVQAYREKFDRIFNQLPVDLGVDPALPLVIGEIADFSGRWPYWRQMNDVLMTIAATRENCVLVQADGLTGAADGIHFSAASYRELGRRYFASFQKATKR
ncbi:MAG: sialate O-acetylesterase [Clostridiales bacterium]|nr:sialate O-acetylesterase [Clostridiales bacterium]